MNQEIKAKWVAALRGGEYTQSFEVLRDFSGFCCLGVLCDLHSIETGTDWEDGKYKNEFEILPKEVTHWVGNFLHRGDSVCISNSYKSLAEHNDAGRTFLEIALAIEEQL